jgi:CO/xanthine dehydrogenase Mo-binding subunit
LRPETSLRVPHEARGGRHARRLFVNHNPAGYEVPVHADIPHQDVILLDETDSMSSPMKA